MKNKAYDLESWDFTASDRILPDANFWINVFGPASSVVHTASKIRSYSSALRRMVAQKASVFIDVTIMSEFLNTPARLEFNSNFRGDGYGAGEFKRFRNSSDFVPIAITCIWS